MVTVNYDEIVNGYGVSEEAVDNVIETIQELVTPDTPITTDLVAGWILNEIKHNLTMDTRLSSAAVKELLAQILRREGNSE